ncbi:MAG: Flp pilus assembly protein CpaB [Peptococcaceae bacterium]|nr:Flp pilus assembly protein CpaB [Peptococcaceae bacterium]
MKKVSGLTIKNSGIYLLIAGLICAALAAFGVVKFMYVSTSSVPVVVAKVEIPPYTKISPESLEIIQLPRSAVQSTMFPSVEHVIGKYARTVIPQGWPVSSSAITEANPGVSGSLAAHLGELGDPKLRAKSIPVDNIYGLNGKVTPGDRVDVVGSMKLPLNGMQQPVAQVIARSVPVLDIIGGPGSMKGIIVALTPQEAQDVDFALANGTVSLMLNGYDANPEDAVTTPTTAESFVNRYIHYNQPQQPSPDNDKGGIEE